MPPPTTLIGALAKGLSYVEGSISECVIKEERIFSYAVKAATFIASAHLGFTPKEHFLCPWSDLTRVFAVPYLQTHHRRPEHSDRWFGVHATGKVFSPSIKAFLAYLIDPRRAEEILGPEWRHTLELSAYSMTSLGSKEGLISVEHVELERAAKVEGIVETQFYAPLEALISPPSGRLLLEFWDHKDLSAWEALSKSPRRRVTYVAPLDARLRRPDILKLSVSPQGEALTIDGTPSTTVVTLRRWLA